MAKLVRLSREFIVKDQLGVPAKVRMYQEVIAGRIGREVGEETGETFFRAQGDRVLNWVEKGTYRDTEGELFVSDDPDAP
jgi:hypothetical protein